VHPRLYIFGKKQYLILKHLGITCTCDPLDGRVWLLFFCFWRQKVAIVAYVLSLFSAHQARGGGRQPSFSSNIIFCWRQNGFFSGLHQQPQRRAFLEDDCRPPLTFLLLILPNLFLVSGQLIYIILVWCAALNICCPIMVHMLYYGCQSKQDGSMPACDEHSLAQVQRYDAWYQEHQ